jgi:hypothetical protein
LDIMNDRIYFERAGDALNAVKHSIFKLELLDEYNASFEKGRQFYKKRGHITPDVLYSYLQGHWDTVARQKRAGIELNRAHAVSLPLSDYLRFEMHSYLISQRMGEKVFLIDRKSFGSIAKPKGIRLLDYLRVDDAVFLTKYANVKNNVGGDMLGGFFIDEQWKVKKYKEYERRILKKAVPMDRFLKTHEPV